MRKFLSFLCCLFLISLVTAQDASSDDDLFMTSSDDDLFTSSSDDDLFGDSMIEETDMQTITEQSSDQNPGSIFETGKTTAGGSLTANIQAIGNWTSPFEAHDDNAQYVKDGFSNALCIPTLSAQFYFDSRPKENLRLYGKAQLDWPFSTELPLSTLTGDMLSDISVPLLTVNELFTDFSFSDNVYYRFGKHTVTWGVGYFFSPADIINVTEIDPENPDEQLEGPVSLRTQILFPGTQNCLWAYVIPDTETFLAKKTALAAKAEILIGDYELGFGGWYKYTRPPRAMITCTGSLFGKIGLFGEGVFAWGSEEQWLNWTNLQSIEVNQMDPVFQATVGASYYWSTPKITFNAQYCYDGQNISDSNTSDIGVHQIAGVISCSEFFSNDLSLTAFGLYDVGGKAANTSLMLNWTILSRIVLTTGPSVIIGETENAMNTFGSPSLFSYTIKFALNGGKF